MKKEEAKKEEQDVEQLKSETAVKGIRTETDIDEETDLGGRDDDSPIEEVSSKVENTNNIENRCYNVPMDAGMVAHWVNWSFDAGRKFQVQKQNECVQAVGAPPT